MRCTEAPDRARRRALRAIGAGAAGVGLAGALSAWPAAAAPAADDEAWAAFKLQAARRLVDANPGRSYVGVVPEPLLAIPVLRIELDAHGGVRRIQVVREPSQARDTVALAIAAVRRAAPFGDVRHLPRPWAFVEVFLFDDERRFMPATLDR